MSALDGLRVVEIASVEGAFAAKLLGDMGADVVVVEPPGGALARTFPPFADDQPGPDRSLWWWHYNTSKRSVVLDLDDAGDRQRYRRLVSVADVVIEATVPGWLAERGIDHGDFADQPGLIHAALTAAGRQSPVSQQPFTDLTLLAAGGPVWSCGYDEPELPPVRGGGNQALHTACHFAAMAVLTAIFARAVNGRGQFIDVNMRAAQNVSTEAATYEWLVAGGTVRRQTGRHAAVQATGETQMQCADGRWVNTGVPPRRPEEFARLLGWMEASDLIGEFPEAVFLEMGAGWDGPFDLSRLGEDDTLTAIFSAGRDALRLVASKVTAYEFFIGCQQAGLAVGVIYAPEEAFDDPHFLARGFAVEVEHPELGRSVTYPGAPYQLSASPWAIHRRPPLVGEHQEQVFQDWGSVG